MLFLSEKIHSIRFKLIASLIAVSLLIGLISLTVGGNLLYQSVLDEANNRIRQDLNVARVIYDDRVNAVRLALEVAASAPGCRKTVSSAGPASADEAVGALAERLNLDFLGVTDNKGRMTYRYKKDSLEKVPDVPSANPLVLRVLETSRTVAGTLVLSQEQLHAENPSLTDHVNIKIHHLTDAAGQPPRQDIDAMMIGAAVPVFSSGRVTGIIYGGYLLNNDTGIVDKIGETVFKNEIYKGSNVGTATIFCNDLRISTSVKDPSGRRAIGTFASPEVAGRVLGEGKRWTDRARVLNDWYITAYEPITDITGRKAGMLYVGVLEAKYADVRQKAVTFFAGITMAGVLVAIVLGWLFTGRIMRPVSCLIRASAEISGGNFSPDIGPISKDDIGRLQKKFLIMAKALKERQKRHLAESETRLMQSEKQASVGKLAAGVAHEINNPLTAVLTFTHLILRRNDLPVEVRSDLETVASQTERVRGIVKSLLDFSRQTAIQPEPMDINRLIEDSVALLKNQALIKHIALSFKGEADLPALTLDRNQFQSVLVNMIINALDATPSGGSIDIQTRLAEADGNRGVEIQISDTGTGISPDHMDKLFDPFFTTKEVGQGTGLGLAVSAGIVERHNGTVKVWSKPGKGAEFTIWLPRQKKSGLIEKDTDQEARS